VRTTIELKVALARASQRARRATTGPAIRAALRDIERLSGELYLAQRREDLRAILGLPRHG
jgi:hypothetical protein